MCSWTLYLPAKYIIFTFHRGRSETADPQGCPSGSRLHFHVIAFSSAPWQNSYWWSGRLFRLFWLELVLISLLVLLLYGQLPSQESPCLIGLFHNSHHQQCVKFWKFTCPFKSRSLYLYSGSWQCRSPLVPMTPHRKQDRTDRKDPATVLIIISPNLGFWTCSAFTTVLEGLPYIYGLLNNSWK